MEKAVNKLKGKLTLVILGRSGSGKGTQASFILRRWGRRAVHFSTGVFLRRLLTKKNSTTIMARRVIRDGRIFPSWLPAYTWLKELIEKGHGNKHIIFDGAPRRIWEAELLDEVMKWHGRPLPVCIYIDVSEGEVTRRLLVRGRADDTSVPIRNRMAYFRKDVLPVINRYGRARRLIRVNGEGSEREIAQEIFDALTKKFGRLRDFKLLG